MHQYVRKLQEHWKEYPKDQKDFDSVLELLSYYFMIENAAESAVIRTQFYEVDKILEKLSLEDNNALFSTVVHLCDTHSVRGFVEGFCVGAQLMLELQSIAGDSVVAPTVMAGASPRPTKTNPM